MTRGYTDAGPTLVARYEAIDPEALYAPVIDLFPVSPARIADIGAGTGRDAAWFARRGHRVTAIEPSLSLRETAMRAHADLDIAWIDESLPHLSTFPNGSAFDFILLSGVWQHLDRDDRRVAITRLACLLAPRGSIVMSLRHGPGAATRPVYPLSVDETISDAAAHGLLPIRNVRAPSIQAENRAAGIEWTWLAFERAQACPADG